MAGPIQLGMYQQDPAAQQAMLQQQAQQRAMAEQAMAKRAALMQQQQQAQQAQQMQAMQQQAPPQAAMPEQGMPQQAGPPQMPPVEEHAQQASLMAQLGQFGSPANSALLNAGLATMNAGQQGQSTGRSLLAGLGGGLGAYGGAKQVQDEKARQEASMGRQRRLEELQMLALQQGLQLGQGIGDPQQQQAPGFY